jgi:hypothetical protein
MAEVLGLDDELGDVELVERLQRSFAVKLDDDELLRCVVVDDLHRLLLAAVPHAERSLSGCLTAKAFYRLKRTLTAEEPGLIVRPTTPLVALAGDRRAGDWLQWLERTSKLRMPGVEMESRGCLLMLAGIAVPIACGWIGDSVGFFLALPAALAGFWFARRLTRFPKWLATVGDLARAVAALNVAALRIPGEPLRKREIWTALEWIVGDMIGWRVPVQPAARFFPEKP